MSLIRSLILLICIIGLALTSHATEDDIFSASENGNIEVVKQLLEKNPELLTNVDESGYSILHYAVYANKMEVTRYLLSKDADINFTARNGSTPLHGAAAYGHFEMAQFLLSSGANQNISNARGNTPLVGALGRRHIDIVRLLVENGADLSSCRLEGYSPLFHSLYRPDVELTKLLLELGADPYGPTNDGTSMSFFVLARRDTSFISLLTHLASDFSETDSAGMTMMHFAAARGLTDQVQMLLDKGADINATDLLGKRPLDFASLWGKDETVKFLKEHGALSGAGEKPWFTGDYFGKSNPGKIPTELISYELRNPFPAHGSMTFSPDGKELLWGHRGTPVFGAWYSKQVDGIWQKPITAPYSEQDVWHSEGSPSFSSDGNRIYYASRMPLSDSDSTINSSNIWYVEREDDSWSAPIPLGSVINSDKGEWSPFVTASGNMYFSGFGREDSFGDGDLYFSEFVNGAYTEPVNLGPRINSNVGESSPVVPSDESYILFASDKTSRHQRQQGLHVTFKKDDGSWSKAVYIGQTPIYGRAWRTSITGDDKFIIYQQGEKYYWFSTDLIEDLRTAVIGTDGVEATTLVPEFSKSEQVFEFAATNDIALGDLDSDGDLDAVFANMYSHGSQVYLNDGNGRFSGGEKLVPNYGNRVDMGDIDSDGDLDIVIACASGGTDLMVYLNDGQAHFTLVPQNLGIENFGSYGIELRDFDSDGDLDAAVVHKQLRNVDHIYLNNNRIYLNDGNGIFTHSDLTFPKGTNWGDLDGDGDLDILQREEGVGFKTLLNDGSGHFVEQWSKADSGLHRGWTELSDFDKDGDLDAVITFHDMSEHRFSTVWYNDGKGNLVESDVKLPLTRYARISTGDFNGDSFSDLLISNVGLPGAVWLNDGKGGIVDSGIRLPGVWQNSHASLGDLDGDGDLDIFNSAYGAGSNEVWFNNKILN